MEIYKKMADVMKKIGSIEKGTENRQQGFKFRRIDDIYNGLHDALATCDIFCTPTILKTIREEKITTAKGGIGWHIVLEIEYTFFTTDGSNVKAVVWGEATDYGDKCINKCMSIAHKYALIQVFTIPTEDLPDPDDKSPEVTNEKKQSSLKCLNEPKKTVSGIDLIIRHFAELNVNEVQLEEYLGKPLNEIQESDKSKLRVLAQKIKNGEFIE